MLRVRLAAQGCARRFLRGDGGCARLVTNLRGSSSACELPSCSCRAGPACERCRRALSSSLATETSTGGISSSSSRSSSGVAFPSAPFNMAEAPLSSSSSTSCSSSPAARQEMAIALAEPGSENESETPGWREASSPAAATLGRIGGHETTQQRRADDGNSVQSGGLSESAHFRQSEGYSRGKDSRSQNEAEIDLSDGVPTSKVSSSSVSPGKSRSISASTSSKSKSRSGSSSSRSQSLSLIFDSKSMASDSTASSKSPSTSSMSSASASKLLSTSKSKSKSKSKASLSSSSKSSANSKLSPKSKASFSSASKSSSSPSSSSLKSPFSSSTSSSSTSSSSKSSAKSSSKSSSKSSNASNPFENIPFSRRRQYENAIIARGVQMFGEDWEHIRLKLLPYMGLYTIKTRFFRFLHPNIRGGTWALEEDQRLLAIMAKRGFTVENYNPNPRVKWLSVSEEMNWTRNPDVCRSRWQTFNPNCRRGLWTTEEDTQLLNVIARCGDKDWHNIANVLANGRTSEQCRTRYFVTLHPNLRRGPWTKEEDNMLLEAYDKFNGRWNMIADELTRRVGKLFSSLRCVRRWRNYFQRTRLGKWEPDEDARLLEGRALYGNNSWTKIAEHIGTGRSAEQTRTRYTITLHEAYSREKWTVEEDWRLTEAIRTSPQHEHGVYNWSHISQMVATRSSCQCRSRWLHSLSATVSCNPFSPDEDNRLIEAVMDHAPCWFSIHRVLASPRSVSALRSRWKAIIKVSPELKQFNDKVFGVIHRVSAEVNHPQLLELKEQQRRLRHVIDTHRARCQLALQSS